MSKKETPKIHIKGARVHNLKNIEVEIPHNQLVVVTGLSGSGKSTLAFDTIFAEGQRCYVESLSAYARQFLGKIDKPDVDFITGIAPAIAIQQQVNTRNPRSTVGTSTEIYDYMKLLFARVGHTFSPVTGQEVRAYYVKDVVDYVTAMPAETRIIVASPVALREGETFAGKLGDLLKEGVQRLYVGGKTVLIEDFLSILSPAADPADFSVVVDRMKAGIQQESVNRLADSIAAAFNYGDGVCRIITEEERPTSRDFSSRFEADGIRFEHPSEHLFSFNNPIGACPRCEGYGKVIGIDEDLVVPDKNKTIYEDAIACWKGDTMKLWKEELVYSSSKFDFPIHTPYHSLTKQEKALLWRGNEYFHGLDDFFRYLESERFKIQYRVLLSRYTGKTLCPDCGGARLRPEALYVKVGGRNIAELVTMPAAELKAFFDALELDDHDTKTGGRILTEIRTRLQYMLDVGLGYLTLDRLSSTLSGGESQRINLSSSLGSNLTGSLYVLDEPSIGLHPRDTQQLIHVLKQLRDLGNTVIVVEHEEEIIRAADQIIDMGPGAGYNGGEVVFSGNLPSLMQATDSLTADYLSGRRSIPRPDSPRGWSNYIEVKGAREHNLKGIDVKIPLGAMTCVTGVSGSGKSSLVKGILYPALRRMLLETGLKPGNFDKLTGDVGMLKAVEMIDQNPIGRSSRSNPVTYIKAYDEIRKLFADQPFAKSNGYTPSHFSFNIAGGRCEECQGEGFIKVEMQFMADVELRCECCGGRRFKDEILEVRYQGMSIYDVLELTIEDAIALFSKQKDSTAKRIAEKLQTLADVGLGYVKLGQSSSTLSGGESQRVKLASFLLRENTSGHVMFIFDEPTTGLHLHDINKLLTSINALITRGHTVIIVEHNMEVIKCADWVIDLGPEGGDQGGQLVYQGTVDGLAKCKESYTGQYLAKHD